MAASKSYFPRSTHLFLSPETKTKTSIDSDSTFDFDESDLWNSSNQSSSESLNAIAGNHPSSSSRKKKPLAFKHSEVGQAASLPINVPDWSKILKHEYREKRRFDSDEDEDGGDGGGDEDDMIPPHEFLAKQKQGRRVAFSVYEGIGRTLKGRDLSRIRDAIWEKTGFQH
ncbi:uncharacterized protein LOC124912579 [Impatiens glandulifera]|uniref:uncharacterized protein LOC124912579 n=1 Tax=Impatiens glandulifera TaxID=253017 RepID=UPI001FB12319|nr:uncharacterized protein LOC124912579 [Impatiens glandulifera]